MKFQHLIGAILAAGSAFSLVAAGSTIVEEANAVPEIVATAAFLESNAFGLVVNGEQNSMTVTVENKSDRNVTLVGIAGSLRHPETDILVKNLTASKIAVPLFPDVPIRVPYTFHSEFKPGDLRLNIWLDNVVDKEKFQVVAYDSIVKIVEPEMSIFDLKMILTYLIVFAFLGGISYYTYLTLFPQTKKPRGKAAAPTSAPVTVTAAATGAGGYEEEWIPEHHLKKTKSGKKQSTALSGTSGDDFSGAETSGAEGKRRRARK